MRRARAGERPIIGLARLVASRAAPRHVGEENRLRLRLPRLRLGRGHRRRLGLRHGDELLEFDDDFLALPMVAMLVGGCGAKARSSLS